MDLPPDKAKLLRQCDDSQEVGDDLRPAAGQRQGPAGPLPAQAAHLPRPQGLAQLPGECFTRAFTHSGTEYFCKQKYIRFQAA